MNDEIPYNPPGMDDYIREGARKNAALLRKMQGQPAASETAEAKPDCAPRTGSDASIKPQMSDEELANKLMCVLTQEMIRKSELFDYLCWLEEKEQGERVPEADFLVLASDGRTCWGKSYAAAVAGAMEHDAKPYGEHQNSPDQLSGDSNQKPK